jgi:hypothetical protein
MRNGVFQRQVIQRLGSGPSDGEAIKVHPFFKLINWADVLGRKLEPPFKPALVCTLIQVSLYKLLLSSANINLTIVAFVVISHIV